MRGGLGRSPEAGFTLVELLIALFLFALLSAAGTALLTFGVDAQGRTTERLASLAAVVRGRALLTADLAQAAPRLWRDEAGAVRPAFGGGEAAAVLRLVRRGWANDGGAARSSLQRVEYRLNGDRLERTAWPMVDGAAANPPALVMDGVMTLRVRFLQRGQWLDVWQPEARDALPEAIEMIITAQGVPELRQLFVVGPGPVT